MSAQPVTFAADFTADRSRLTTFFRLILAIPHLLVVALYGFGAFFAIIAAWFALVFTARWPLGLYGFVGGFFRWSTRVQGYVYLMADPYPPFDGGEHPEHPIRLVLGPPKESYSRARAALRLFMAIPVYIVCYVLSIVAELIAILSWFVIVITGRQVEALHNILAFSVGYQMRGYAFMGLVFEEWPSFSNEAEPSPPAAPASSPQPPPTSFAPPEAPERP